jgi:dehydrogenase/reductase SDR family protein 12
MRPPSPPDARLWSLARTALAPVFPLAFGAPGHRLAALAFEPLPADAMQGRTAMITGANGGLGLAASRAMAAMGARVVLACRDPARGQAAMHTLGLEVPDASLELEPLDVSDPASIQALGQRWGQRPLHVLVHNAAVLPASFERSSHGEERALATNLLGPLRLTRALLPALDAAAPARVVMVSSGGMFTQRLDPKLLDPDPAAPYDGAVAYARTKRALVALGELWAERWSERGIAVHAMHPGWADTPGVRSSLPRFHRVTRPFLRDAAQGADTIAWLAAAPAHTLGSGGFWFDRQRVSPSPLPGTRVTPQGRALLEAWLEGRA